MQTYLCVVLILATTATSSAQILNGSFPTHIDHFRPQNYDRATFVSCLFILHAPRIVTLTQSYPFISTLKQIIVTFNMVDRLTFISKMLGITPFNGSKKV